MEPDAVLQIGVPPRRIDVLTGIDGVEFDEAWPKRYEVEIEGLTVLVIGKEDLIRNKHACGRPEDLSDVGGSATCVAPTKCRTNICRGFVETVRLGGYSFNPTA